MTVQHRQVFIIFCWCGEGGVYLLSTADSPCKVVQGTLAMLLCLCCYDRCCCIVHIHPTYDVVNNLILDML